MEQQPQPQSPQQQLSQRCPMSGGGCSGGTILGCRFWRTVPMYEHNVLGTVTQKLANMCQFDHEWMMIQEMPKAISGLQGMIFAIVQKMGIGGQKIVIPPGGNTSGPHP